MSLFEDYGAFNGYRKLVNQKINPDVYAWTHRLIPVAVHINTKDPFQNGEAYLHSVKLRTRPYITKTRLYNLDPLQPHFNIAKLGFTGVYINFLISAQKIDCGYSLEPPREYPQSMF